MNRIAKNYFYNMFTQVISFIVPIILVPYTSRTLGVDNIGIYSYMFSIVTIFSSIGRLGLNTYGQLLVSKNREDKTELTNIVNDLIKLRFISSAIVIALYTSFIMAFNQNTKVGLLMTLYLIADAFDILWLFQGLEMFKYIALRTLLIRTLNLTLIILFVHGFDDLYVYVVIMQATALITNLFLWTNIRKYIYGFHILSANAVGHLRNCFIYLIPTIANLIYNMLDKTMLGYIGKSTYESGCYEQAYKIITIAQTVLLTIASTALPQLAYLFQNGKRREFENLIRTSMRILNLLIFPMAAGLFVNAKLIVNVVLGESFEGSIDILRCLSILLIFATFNYNIGNEILISTGSQKLYNIGVVSGAVVNLYCNFLLIPRYAGMGAAYGSLLAEIIVFVMFVFFAGRVISLKGVFNVKSLQYLVFALLMSAVNIFLLKIFEGKNELCGIAMIIFVCVMFYMGALALTKDEVLMGILRKVYGKVQKEK